MWIATDKIGTRSARVLCIFDGEDFIVWHHYFLLPLLSGLGTVLANSGACGPLFALSFPSAQAQVFHFEIFVDPIFGALAPESWLLDAAEGGRLLRNQTSIDAYHAEFELFGHAPTRAMSRV